MTNASRDLRNDDGDAKPSDGTAGKDRRILLPLRLLTFIVFVVGIIRSFFSPEMTRRAHEGKPLFLGNIMASALGIVTTVCSCSAIPLFLGFMESGMPLGVTFSFLIAAPMINEVALVLLFGLFGWKTALLYASTGLVIAILSGRIIGRLKVERFVEAWVYEVKVGAMPLDDGAMNAADRLRAGYAAVIDIVSRVWIFIVIGIGVGAGIHGYVPENFMASFMGTSSWWSIPLAFMMPVIGLSLPEMIILKKVLKLPLNLLFVGIVATGIMIVGVVFNILY